MRKSRAKKRILSPDPRFNDTMITRFANNLMYDGKKSAALTTLYEAIDIVSQKTEQDGLQVWRKALENVMPSVEVKSRRVGGSNFQIPQEIRPDRRVSMGMKWMISYARQRNEKSMGQKLAAEIIAASKEEGASFKKKEDVHKMAEANKAYSHFRV
ncbi:MAG: 30S ribosomal protein S7 [Bacteroidetes bacterium]|nr:30S ribosomal protein S7 [Bacteroidota bacterium]